MKSDNARKIFEYRLSDPLFTALLAPTPLSIILERGLVPLDLPRHRSLSLLEASPWIFGEFLRRFECSMMSRWCIAAPAVPAIFIDGFESGNSDAWTNSVP